MKTKTILLSAIILGGFTAPIIQQTTASAHTINTEVIQNKNETTGKHTNNQEPRAQQVKLTDKISLDKLNTSTSIVIPSTNKNINTKLDDIYINLNDSEIAKLKSTKETDFTVNDLEITTSWKGILNYSGAASSTQLRYDDKTQTLSLLSDGQKTDHITYNFISGDANIHYIFEDTKQEIYQHVQKNTWDSDGVTVDTLEDLDKDNLLNGHFDAVDIDFENLSEMENPNNPINIYFNDDPLVKTYDPDTVSPENAEFTVELKKADPSVVNLNVYLDGNIFSQKTIKNELYTEIPEDITEELPTPGTATLNRNKTLSSVSHTYFPQLGVTSMSGKAFHQLIFDLGLDEPLESGFLNKALHYYTNGKMKVNLSMAGRVQNLAIYYESKNYSDDQNDSVTTGVTISTNLGKQFVPNITGKKGETITVKVPQINGFKPDKDTVTAKVNADGTITTDDFVIYHSTNNSGSTQPPTNPAPSPLPTPTPNPDKMNGFVGTMKESVKLYQLDNDKFSVLTNKALSKHTDWKFDQHVKIDNQIYYRVAVNEWVRAQDVYRYQVESGVVETKDKEITNLVSSDTKLISNRGLAAHTGWQYDRIAYLGNNQEKHYRVATDEFVHVNDVNKN